MAGGGGPGTAVGERAGVKDDGEGFTDDEQFHEECKRRYSDTNRA